MYHTKSEQGEHEGEATIICACLSGRQGGRASPFIYKGSSQRADASVEGEAPKALPLEGATQA
ncbi:MAG: hypothetical protein HZA13_04290, partial [Nitrospirae bacterium]|nr:hypothetical protein [Nitrospirota bacterium]